MAGFSKSSTAIAPVIAVVIAVGIAFAVGFFGWPRLFGPKGEFLLNPHDEKIVARGQQIYRQECATCHGAELEGQPNWRSPDADGMLPAPPHDETGHTWHHTDEVLFELTKYGLAKMSGLTDHKTNMPTYEGVLSDEEIIAVLSFIKSRWPEDVRNRHDEMNLAAKGNE